MGATVVSGVDAPPVFEAPEHVFDLVALLVEDGIMRLALEGMQGVMRRLARAARNQSAS